MTLFGQRRVTTVKQDDPRPTAKPFEIPKRLVYEAWKRVAANKGAPGVDNESIQVYQENLGGNLYKLWNRMSSGSYHHEIASEAGIGRSTLTCWLRNHKNDGNKNLTEKEKRPQDWTVEQRLVALMETGAMTEGDRVSWCRKRGVFSRHLEQWKKEILSLLTPNKASLKSKGTAQLKKENAALKKELKRKDKALAETAALLVL